MIKLVCEQPPSRGVGGTRALAHSINHTFWGSPIYGNPKSGLTNAIQLVMPRFESVKTASAKVLWRIRI